MKYIKIPKNAAGHMVLNAGMLLSDFDPETGKYQEECILGLTKGGLKFTAQPEYKDLGSDIDGVPEGVRELQLLQGYKVQLSGTLLTQEQEAVRRHLGAAEVAAGAVRPRADLAASDFETLWWVGDLGSQGDFLAIRMDNVLSTGGYALKTDGGETGQSEFTYRAHYSLENLDTPPFAIYFGEEATA
jgi:hypothetical protein